MIKLSKIAIINPLMDYGISSYSFELAEGLANTGAEVCLYSGGLDKLHQRAHRHRVMPVLGGALIRRHKAFPEQDPSPNAVPLQSNPAPTPLPLRQAIIQKLRPIYLPLELAIHLKMEGYDLVWTQWPSMDGYGSRFWKTLKTLGVRVAHTVHNVLPHEQGKDDRARCGAVYENSDFLFVHSYQAQRDFGEIYPEFQSKTIVSRHGIYTIYSRCPDAHSKVRSELSLNDTDVVILFCGGIRPYKNLDTLLAALAQPEFSKIKLIIAGVESGYPDAVDHDPLARARKLTAHLDLGNQVRLLPGFKSNEELASLLEASDVLALPYKEGYGSGLLLLGMTFERHILASRVGGTEEYLSDYPRATLLDSTDEAGVAAGLRNTLQAIRGWNGQALSLQGSQFDWKVIANHALAEMRSRLAHD